MRLEFEVTVRCCDGMWAKQSEELTSWGPKDLGSSPAFTGHEQVDLLPRCLNVLVFVSVSKDTEKYCCQVVFKPAGCH